MSVITETAERDDQYIRKLKQERDDYRQIVRDSVEDLECLPFCDSYGHEEGCPVVNGMAAWSRIRKQRDAALERERQKDRQIADLREALVWYERRVSTSRSDFPRGREAKLDLMCDGGHIARAALAKARGEKNCGNCGYDIPKEECPVCNESG